MKIIGANLGEIESEYKPLSEWNYTSHPDGIRILKYLENIYYNAVENVKDTTINDFPTEGNQVIVQPGMINHRCSLDIGTLKGISEYGVLASEWFGQYESELEGRFCTFVDRIKPEDYIDQYENYRRLNAGYHALLFFDAENKVMQYLLHLDYFKYEGIKRSNPNRIEEMYTKEEIELFEEVIEPLSPAGKDFHDEDKKKLRYYYWSAIPGGIPSELVNGICLTSNEYTEEYIEQLSNLFPNATIFNGLKQIIFKPEKTKKHNR